MEHGFFRKDALEHTEKRFSQPSGFAGVSGTAIALLILLILAGAATLLSTIEYSRKVTSVGSLIPLQGAVRLVSDRPGVITDVYVEDGAEVKKGEEILAVSGSPTLEGGMSLGEALAEASREQKSALTEDLSAREMAFKANILMVDLEEKASIAEIQSLDRLISLQKKRVLNAEANVTSAQELAMQKLVSMLEYRSLEEKLLDARQNLATLEQQHASATAKLRRADVQRLAQEADLNLQRARLNAEMQGTHEKIATASATRRIVLSSPRNGRVTGLRTYRGDAVNPGVTLATILPSDESVLAELWVSSQAIAFVKPGSKVKLMYNSYPYQKFGAMDGEVTSVAQSPTDPLELPTQFRGEESLYRVIVRPAKQHMSAYNTDRPLTPGMRLTADLILDKKSLIRWLLDPLIASNKRTLS